MEGGDSLAEEGGDSLPEEGGDSSEEGGDNSEEGGGQGVRRGGQVEGGDSVPGATADLVKDREHNGSFYAIKS